MKTASIDSKEKLVAMVKAAGQEVINRAEDLVGEAYLLTDFDIGLYFPIDGDPEISVSRTHTNFSAKEVLFHKETDKTIKMEGAANEQTV